MTSPATNPLDFSHVSPARRYDYLLGGKDNVAADRRSADQLEETLPSIRLAAAELRRCMERHVVYLANAGVRQFLDIGYGLPHAPNMHEIAQPGRLTVCRPGPTGNAPLDAALAAVEQTVRAHRSGDQLRAWLRSFAATDLYERIRGAMVAVGLLQRTERRRLAGLVKTETHLPVHYGYAVRARAHIRDAVIYHTQQGRLRYAAPDDECAALCGLVAALELAEFLYDGSLSTRDLTQWLWHVVAHHENPTITAVVQAVDAGRGDLAVAAMR